MASVERGNTLRRLLRKRLQYTRNTLLCVIVLGICAAASPAVADGFLSREEDPYKASTSRKTREAALKSIPLERLTPKDRAVAESILSDISIFRRLPTQVIQCDPNLYLFLVHHPDVVIGIWEAMGISKISVEQTGPNTYKIVDNAGTVGTAEFLYRSSDTHIIRTQGVYDGPLMSKPAQGSGILVLKTAYVIEPDGHYYITARLDAFMQIDNLGLEMMTKIFHPLLGRIADYNFQQTLAFVGSLSRTAEVNLSGVEEVATKLTKVPPEVRSRFVALSRQVAEKAEQVASADPTKTAMQPGAVELK